MRFHFTEEDQSTRIRARDIRAGLVHARHEVSHGEPGQAAPEGTDVWMHGLAIEGSPPMTDAVAEQLLTSRARVFIFQLCDGASLAFERVPAALLERATMFLRNHWPSDKSGVPVSCRDRLGWLPPMVKPMAPAAGSPLAARQARAIFYGARTGFANLDGGRNARDETVRLMRASGLPFQGGILAHSDPRYPVEPELLVERVSEAVHAKLLADSKICLAPWGNHPITYRFFEGLSRRCLVLTQSLRGTEFIDGGLKPGTHYVEVAADLSDLTDKVRFYLGNDSESQRIADAGHEHFRRYFAARGKLISEYLFQTTVESWRGVYRRSDAHGPATLLRSAAAQLFPSRF